MGNGLLSVPKHVVRIGAEDRSEGSSKLKNSQGLEISDDEYEAIYKKREVNTASLRPGALENDPDETSWSGLISRIGGGLGIGGSTAQCEMTSNQRV